MTTIQNLAEKGFTAKLEGKRLAITPKANLTDSLREFIRVNKAKLVSELQDEKLTELVSSAFDSSHFRESFKNNDDIATFKAGKFHEVLNGFIEKGITFEVSETDLNIVDPARILKTSDKQFLQINNAAILCQLQQSLLMKHLFSHSPELFEDFAFEIMERECLISPLPITDTTRFEIYLEAVKSTTRKWFAELLNKKT